MRRSRWPASGPVGPYKPCRPVPPDPSGPPAIGPPRGGRADGSGPFGRESGCHHVITDLDWHGVTGWTIRGNAMIKTLRPVGNSLGLIIDRPILELLGIDQRTRLRIRTDGKVLTIEPVAREGRSDTGPPSGRGAAVEKAPKRSGDKKSR